MTKIKLAYKKILTLVWCTCMILSCLIPLNIKLNVKIFTIYSNVMLRIV